MISKLKALVCQDDFWHGSHRIPDNIPDEDLKSYYADLSKKCIKNNISLNKIDDFVPKVKNQYGEHIHPVTVCQVGLGCIEYFNNRNSSEHYKRAILCADWLLKNSHSNNKKEGLQIYWTVPYSFKLFHLKKDFKSGLIQGQAISLLIRVYKATKDNKYLIGAEGSYNFMMTPINKGGCLNTKLNIIEEYINDKYDTTVLNGAISSVWSIYDMWLATNDCKYQIDFKNLQSALMSIVTKFDTGYWSLYCLKKSTLEYSPLASKYYHEEHIIQFKIMYKITGEEKWLSFSEKFKKYSRNKLVNYYVFFRKAIARIIQEALAFV
jgi:hypothetical protein